jgi:hypothetical protein
MKIFPPKKWAVVQDLRPFGFRIDSVYRSKRRAERVARPHRLLTVMPVDEVRAHNRRLNDPSEFEKELHANPVYRERRHG